MKKICMLIIILLFMPGMAIYATFDPYQPAEFIIVSLYDSTHPFFTQEEPVNGHLDMLVKRSLVGDRLLPEVSDLFIENFGDPSDMDYLDLSQEWISYVAYVDQAYMLTDTVIRDEYNYAYREDIIHFGSFKFIYVDPSGQTISETEEITIVPPSEGEWIEVSIHINIETGEHNVWTRYDEYVTTDWGDVIGAVFDYIFRMLFIIISIILGSSLLLIGSFKIYENIQKKRGYH